jgi:hypothetical protein
MRYATRAAGLVAGLVTAALLVVPAVQAGAAKGGPPAEEGLGNNLSVPTYFVPSTVGAPALRTACPTGAVDPTGTTALFNNIEYWLQKTDAVWSAECSNADLASVTASWGSNLTNDRAIKAGKPIRVEMALLSGDTGIGYEVVNLTPDLPDRQSTYGTLGVPASMAYMVWAAGAELRIQAVGAATPIYNGAFTSEINSTGKVIYGYNWGIKGKTSAPTPGTYELTFTVPAATTITGNVDEGVVNTTFTAQTSTVTINVAAGGRIK